MAASTTLPNLLTPDCASPRYCCRKSAGAWQTSGESWGGGVYGAIRKSSVTLIAADRGVVYHGGFEVFSIDVDASIRTVAVVTGQLGGIPSWTLVVPVNHGRCALICRG